MLNSLALWFFAVVFVLRWNYIVNFRPKPILIWLNLVSLFCFKQSNQQWKTCARLISIMNVKFLWHFSLSIIGMTQKVIFGISKTFLKKPSSKRGWMPHPYTANIYSQTTALLRQKGCTLDFAMTIGGILEFAVPLLLKSHIYYYWLL